MYTAYQVARTNTVIIFTFPVYLLVPDMIKEILRSDLWKELKAGTLSFKRGTYNKHKCCLLIETVTEQTHEQNLSAQACKTHCGEFT